MYIYTNKKGDNYVLYYSEIKLRGGQRNKIYYLLREDKQPANALFRSYRAEKLPDTMVIKEIGINATPLVYKVKNGKDE